MPLAHLLARQARQAPGRPAIFDGTRPWATHAQWAARSAALARRLHAAGLAPGDRVVLFMRNHPRYLEILWGAWWAGLAVVPVNAKLHPSEVAWIVDDAQARWAFVTADVAPSALPGLARQVDVQSPEADALLATGPDHGPDHGRNVERGAGQDAGQDAGREAGRKVLQDAGQDFGDSGLDRTHDHGPALASDGAWTAVPIAERGPDDLAWLFYTSGTTGRPKGVMLTHRNLMTMGLGYFADVDPVSPDDAIVYAAPMSHGCGLYAIPHLMAGARHVVPASGTVDPAELFALGRALGPLSTFAAPTIVKRLVDHAESEGLSPEDAAAAFKTIVYGGAPMYLADIQRALRVMGPRFVQIYGQGETPMVTTVLSRRLMARGTDGTDTHDGASAASAMDATCAPGTTNAAHGADATDVANATNAANRSSAADVAHQRYLQRLASVGIAQTPVQVRVADAQGRSLPPGETGEVLVRGDTVMAGYWRNPEATAAALRGGWLWTGDLGSLDADGFLTLKDRSKDLVISGGSNIYPREVEEVLLTAPGVAEVAVVGAPDPEWGEVVVAFVVRQPGTGSTVATEATLDAHCLAHIARFKRPKRYVFTDSLPKNNYGKVLKTALRERLRQGD
jgi:long-chain acyl-CoA synthetase